MHFDSPEKIQKRLEKYTPIYANVSSAAIAQKAHFVLDSIIAKGHDLNVLAPAAMRHGVQNAARFVAQLHRIVRGVDAVPIGPESPAGSSLSLGTTASPILNIVLHALPVPTDDTPWEKIIDFRSDEVASTALRRLRRWMRHLASEARSEKELKDELEGLFDEYREYMRVHKLKTTRGTIETVVTTVGEVAENVLKLRFGKLANLLFAASGHRVSLLEAELAAPGREVAYIIKAQEAFP